MYTGSLQLKKSDASATAQALLSIVAEELRRHKPKHLEQGEDHIEFKAGVLRTVWSWNLLGAITSGTVSFTEEDCCLQYALSFVELALFGVALTVFGLIAASLGGAPRQLLIAWPMVVWLWLVGMNYVTGILRFRGLISRCIKKSAFEKA